jgi:hypothetical protein
MRDSHQEASRYIGREVRRYVARTNSAEEVHAIRFSMETWCSSVYFIENVLITEVIPRNLENSQLLFRGARPATAGTPRCCAHMGDWIVRFLDDKCILALTDGEFWQRYEIAKPSG